MLVGAFESAADRATIRHTSEKPRAVAPRSADGTGSSPSHNTGGTMAIGVGTLLLIILLILLLT